jgi:hypothetical protein
VTADVRIARTLDDTDQHEVIADPYERQRVAAYLRSATAILITTATAPDHYAPERGSPVGLSVRSDGVWVWSDAHAYYAEHYGIMPEPELHARIKARLYACPIIDARAAERVLEAFYAAAE